MTKATFGEGYESGRLETEKQLAVFESSKNFSDSYKFGWNSAICDVLCEKLNRPKPNVYTDLPLWTRIKISIEKKVVPFLERIFP